MATTISTADARKHFAEIVNRVTYGKEPIVLTRRGQEVAALVSIDEFELLQQIEDHIDIEDAKKALAEPGENISAEEVWKQLGL
ncbi:MAG: type II toxin-antitoxin system Phd/YefM family antitoxin [Proteobacteria bacterium]|nr:type II toxin-antitoxin system Phd/YefM family antitoxin [Pseudomonadota bacterium]MBU1739643.1 type II toxin-antitoxin system Phd/YefM family antitoxin [Pseudomonadota bacterium]